MDGSRPRDSFRVKDLFSLGTTYLAVAKMGLKSERLDRREADPIGRMAWDSQRTHGVVHARQGTVLGVSAGLVLVHVHRTSIFTRRCMV